MAKYKKGDLVKSTLTQCIYKITEIEDNHYLVQPVPLMLFISNLRIPFDKHYVDSFDSFILIQKKANHPHTNIFK